MDSKNKQKKRLLIFQPTIGTYRVDLFNILSENFDVTVYIEYTSSSNEIFSTETWQKELKFTPAHLKKWVKIGSRNFYKGYWEAIKKTSPDIILVSEFGVDAITSIIYRTLYRKHLKIISVCDDSADMLIGKRDFSSFHKYMRQIVVPRIDDLILVDNRSKDWYQKKYRKGYYFPIISDENEHRKKICKALENAKKLTASYKLNGCKTFIYVGRLIDIKNVETLINAFNHLNESNTKLLIIGDGDKRAELENISSGNQNIIFTGAQYGTDLWAHYWIADALVLPSFIEPFGAVTNEALNAGCKVIVSERAGSACLVEEGVNGYTFNPQDEDALIDRMRLILNDNYKKRWSETKQITLMQILFENEVGNLIKWIMNDAINGNQIRK